MNTYMAAVAVRNPPTRVCRPNRLYSIVSTSQGMAASPRISKITNATMDRHIHRLASGPNVLPRTHHHDHKSPSTKMYDMLLRRTRIQTVTFSASASSLEEPSSYVEAANYSEASYTSSVGESSSILNADTASGSPSLVVSNTHKDAWRQNLGRHPGQDEWLRGPRPDSWFTGVHPRDCPGRTVNEQGTFLHSLPMPQLAAATRPLLQDYFDNSWTLYEMLFAGLNGEEAFYRPPPHELRFAQIFYYGHSACLYVNKLRLAGLLSGPVNPYFESIFEVGVDEMRWDDMTKHDMLWPSIRDVQEYRQQVYQIVCGVLDREFDERVMPTSRTIHQKDPLWAVVMGMEHERIHFETSSVLYREMPQSLVQTPEFWPPLHPSVSSFPTQSKRRSSNPVEGVDFPTNSMVMVEKESTVQLGKPHSFPSFGWDNEYGVREIHVPPFSASQFMISNGEYWQFVKDGGYSRADYWCQSGWQWRAHRNAKWPFFWQPMGPEGLHEYQLRTIFEIVDMPWDWPVDVNYYEAKAFSRWKSSKQQNTDTVFRLITEAEHHVLRPRNHTLAAARSGPAADPVLGPIGMTPAEDLNPVGAGGANLNLVYSSQNPVQALPPSDSGHYDVAGNAWEWTEDHFNALNGFEVHSLYEDFSTPCFDGQHHMIVGGSFISTGDEASVFARFHFRPHFLQHSGFRLVESQHAAPATHLVARSTVEAVTATNQYEKLSFREEATEESGLVDSAYETDSSLDMYLGLHYPYSGVEEGLPPILPHADEPNHALGFPQRVANILASLCSHHGRALDVGCAVGGASFELGKHFKFVDAFDYSQKFVAAAKRLQRLDDERVLFRVPLEGDIYQEVQAVHSPGVSKKVLSNVEFFHGNACELHEMKESGRLGSYDGVMLSNLLCRLPKPQACLDALPRLVNPGGVVVLVTPFSWLQEFSPREEWMGGYYDVQGNAVWSKHTLQRIMNSNGFELVLRQDIPLIIREHARKYQYIVSEATAWKKSG